MAIRNGTFKRWNGSSFDDLIPKIPIANVTNLSSQLNNLSIDIGNKKDEFNLIYSGGASLPTSGMTTLTLNQSINIYLKTLLFEVRVVTGTDSYETHTVIGRIGSNTSTAVSATYDRLFSWTTFDGQYLKVHSFKAYRANGAATTINIGNVKHLIGNFSGATIEWTTTTTTLIYIEKIWVIN